VLKIGQEVEARVIKVDKVERRIGLSIKAANYSEEELKRESEAFDSCVPAKTWSASRKRSKPPRKITGPAKARRSSERFARRCSRAALSARWRKTRRLSAATTAPLYFPIS
jgi:Ribosomal protein S1